MHLYQLPEAFAMIMAQSGEDGSLTPEQIELPDGLTMDLDAKVAAICRKIRECERIAEAIKAEAAELAVKARRQEHTASGLRRYVLACLTQIGVNKAGDNVLSARVGSTSAVEVDIQPESLPPEYQRVKVEADKSALAAAAKEGQELPDGVRLVQRPTLTIR